MTTVRKMALVTHDGKPLAAELTERLGGIAAERGIEINDTEPDLVVALGGDGTVLRAAQLAHAADALLLGVNLGTLGYLTEVEAAAAAPAIGAILDGAFEIEDRMMLSCELADGGSGRHFVGLNEVLVERASSRRLVRLQVSVGGEALAAFNADGVIVATPTGSTAYALSAGGPIVSPRASCLVVAPVNAHMIFARPFVLAPDEEVEVALGGSDQHASLVLDGHHGSEIASGAVVRVKRHPRALRLVRLSGPGFVERLRVKLGLPR